MDLAEVRLWGRRIGAVSQADDATHASFQFDPDFVRSGIQVSPLKMPLSNRVYTFPQLARQSFYGLPGMLADSLPDRFGNALINAWLARQGRRPDDFRSIERLCYVGTRGTGALEFHPSTGPDLAKNRIVQVDALVNLASKILSRRQDLQLQIGEGSEEETLTELLRVGTSVGGTRAKALVAWNPEMNEIRSGQVPADSAFEYWILKFDGIHGPEDESLGDPKGYGAIEYAYSLMARAAGIRMTDCRLLEEGRQRHFMTRRFDRDERGRKLHMVSLAGMAHLDFNQAGAHSYEQALLTIRELDLGMDAVEEQFRRMVFNAVARNQDDHVKNIAFLMDKSGRWWLSPAYDVTYAFNPSGAWTSEHQMSVNGKTDDFTLGDLDAVARAASMKRGRAGTIFEEVRSAVVNWKSYAEKARVSEFRGDRIEDGFRLELPPR